MSPAPAAAGPPDPRPVGGGARRAVLYLLFFASGAAALVYEVMWTRGFTLIFGSTTRAAAVVLAAFFAGLALGSLAGARLAGARERALLFYGLAELVIAAGALAVGGWIALFEALYPRLYGWEAGPLTAVKLGLALVAMAVPCLAMGATLPLLARALVDRAGHLGRRAGLAYGLNTLGATTGVLLAGFVLPPALGVGRTLHLAVAVNVAVGLAAILLWLPARRRGAAAVAPAADDDGGVAEAPIDPAVVAVVFGSGLGTIGLEVLYTRLIVNSTDGSVFSFTLMLATFLVFLGLASLAAGWVADRVASPWKLLGWTQALAVPVILVSPVFFRLRTGEGDATLDGYLLGLVGQLVFVAGPAILLIGVTLPVAWKIATRRAAESGRRVGLLTGLNTLGAVLGSVLAGFFLVPVLGVGAGIVAIALVYALLAFVSLTRAYGYGRALAAATLLAMVATVLAFPKLTSPALVTLLPGQTLVRLIEGESVNLAVIDDPARVRLMKVNDRDTVGSSARLDVVRQRSQGGLPMLLHREPKSVAFIGVGTAISVSAIFDFRPERVLAIELLPEVVAATADFARANRGVLSDPRVETLVADGRNHLYATRERFDVVVGDLYVPWHAGTGYLYTREHFASVRRRLAPGGVFAQWLPSHQLSPEELRIITATFLDVFPAAELWLGPRAPGVLGSVALVGWSGDVPSPPAARAAAEASEDYPGLERLSGPEGLARWASTAPRNTDDFPRIEFSAALSHLGLHQRRDEMRELLEQLRE